MLLTGKKIIAIIIVLLLAGGGGVAYYRWAKKERIVINQGAENSQIPPRGTIEEENKKFNESVKAISRQDKDLDGIIDAEELKQGTNPAVADSDQDGLLDRDELERYKTNPQKSDTDGDGEIDGNEVREGKNPLIPRA